jgi:hypothetical protein
MTDKVLPLIDQLRIIQVRGQAVVLDSDLAAIYGVTKISPFSLVGRSLQI